MKAAYDAGINFFDCAEGYAEGQSEIVMGEAIKKFGYVRSRLWRLRVTKSGPSQVEAQRPRYIDKDQLGRCVR